MKRLLGTIAILFMLTPLAAPAQDHSMMPRGRWWKMPEVAKRLALTSEQQQQLDRVFNLRSKELIDLKATMDKASIELRSSLETFDSSPADVMKHANQVGEARGRLFATEIGMMLDLRAELTEEQWMKLRTAIDQRNERMREPRRPQQRPGGPSDPGVPPRRP
jgi:Spy/CpxP family protein refolding chaperone